MSRPRSVVCLCLPFRPGAELTITGNFPVTEGQWQIVMSVLASMKPALAEMPEEREIGQ